MIAFRFPYILFFFLIFLLLLIIWVKGERTHNKVWIKMTPDLKEKLFSRLDINLKYWKNQLTIIGLLFLIFSAAGPQIGTRVAPIERKGVDLVFAVDVSESMNAQDIKPSRLEKAKFEISQIINQLKGDRIGIIVFAGSSHLYLPLTSDYEASQLFLDALDTKMIPNQGTDLSTALKTAMNVFNNEDDKFKVMVLVTDGEDHEGEAIELASTALNNGIITHAVGVGTVKGSLIPINNGSSNNYKRNKNGTLITSKLNENTLIELASAGGGIYSRFNNRDSKYKEIMSAIDNMEKRSIETHIYSEYEDRYQFFATISFLFLTAGLIMPTRKKRI
jgi:Ca-activated chloride channel family protein|tara:strand:- start:2164 stop:3162 length:999 start_codon:yes stop_codon:yes gene_type:complete